MKLELTVLLAALALAACRGPEPTPPSAPVEVADATPRRSEPAKVADDAGAPPPAVDPPPPGMYALSIQDRTSTCPPATPGSAEAWITFDKNENGKWAANLPVNLAGGSPGSDRNFVVVEVGTTSTSELQPDRTCNWTVRRAMTVREVTPTKLVVDIKSEFTDAVRCTLPRRPVSCSQDAVVTYSLVRPFCPASCIAKATPLKDAGVTASCACANAGSSTIERR